MKMMRIHMRILLKRKSRQKLMDHPKPCTNSIKFYLNIQNPKNKTEMHSMPPDFHEKIRLLEEE